MAVECHDEKPVGAVLASKRLIAVPLHRQVAGFSGQVLD